jgi:hypothetical protein
MIAITIALAFMGSVFYEYIMFPAMCILAGYLIIKILKRIDTITTPGTPGLTANHTWIFAIYSTIITSIVVEVAHIITKLSENMKQLFVSGIPDSTTAGVGVTSFFGTVHPIYVMIVSFVGLNLAYTYFYFKHPEKHWKDIVPHICGILIVVALYAMNLSRFITG